MGLVHPAFGENAGSQFAATFGFMESARIALADELARADDEQKDRPSRC
jgi:hypothetical protein